MIGDVTGYWLSGSASTSPRSPSPTRGPSTPAPEAAIHPDPSVQVSPCWGGGTEGLNGIPNVESGPSKGPATALREMFRASTGSVARGAATARAGHRRRPGWPHAMASRSSGRTATGGSFRCHPSGSRGVETGRDHGRDGVVEVNGVAASLGPCRAPCPALDFPCQIGWGRDSVMLSGRGHPLVPP